MVSCAERWQLFNPMQQRADGISLVQLALLLIVLVLFVVVIVSRSTSEVPKAGVTVIEGTKHALNRNFLMAMPGPELPRMPPPPAPRIPQTPAVTGALMTPKLSPPPNVDLRPPGE